MLRRGAVNMVRRGAMRGARIWWEHGAAAVVLSRLLDRGLRALADDVGLLVRLPSPRPPAPRGD